ncbi:MAG TPA: hypothetical protein VD995_16175 [Azospirillum sp.]|nr:hypothetical protein [Azospirillum sp.]
MGIGRVLLLIAALVGYGQSAMAESITFRQQILSDMDRARLELIQADPAPPSPAPGTAAPPDRAPTPPPAGMPDLEPQQIVAIGLGVVAGLIVLDGVIGLPTVVAAVIGGFAGNWFHRYTQRTSGAKPNPIHYIADGERPDVPLWSTAVATDRVYARP